MPHFLILAFVWMIPFTNFHTQNLALEMILGPQIDLDAKRLDIDTSKILFVLQARW